MTIESSAVADIADAIVDQVGKDIVLGLPVGIGKSVHIADALYRCVAADSSMSLKIFTGLTLEKPVAHGELQQRFLDPLADRLYAGWPTPLYAKAIAERALPPNIDVREFYLRPGAYLGNPLVQRSYTSINYSHVVRELIELGVNVVAQLVATRPASPDTVSLSSNPEVTLDLLPLFDELRANGKRVAIAGQVNRRMPYMVGDAEIPRSRLDFVLDNAGLDFDPFPLPQRRVLPEDYAIAMHVASLVCDGGTLQVGIGSLSDAVAHCLKLRHAFPDVFAEVLAALPGGSGSTRRNALPIETGPFDAGLFASSELMSDALYALFEAGIINRPADESDHASIHAGFIIGSAGFYESLRTLSDADLRRINMTRISRVNTLYHDERRKRQQRQHARFINETMMVTLLGAAVSDALDDGRVVSGVGGQFDFVAMARELEDARSILMCRARRTKNGEAASNIRWSYGHTTVPRHFRDVYATEYGVAATNGKTDEQVIEAMLGVSDAAFQSRLMREARAAGKLAQGYEVPFDSASNTPDAIRRVFARREFKAYFPPYPLGSDLTHEEQALAAALQWLADATATTSGRFAVGLGALFHRRNAQDDAAIARMALDEGRSPRRVFLRRLVSFALRQTAA